MRSISQQEEHTLLKRLSDSDQEAFNQVFDMYRARLYTVALRLLKSTTKAEDVVQEVFLNIWQNRERLSDVKKLDGYLFMMARNKIFDHFKKVANEKEASMVFMQKADFVNDTQDYLADKQYKEILKKIIKNLTPQQQEVYHLAREKHMSHSEIAETLNISRLTVKTHMAHALRYIRKGLKQHIEFSLLIALFFN